MLELTVLLFIFADSPVPSDDVLEKDALSEDSKENMGEAKRATG